MQWTGFGLKTVQILQTEPRDKGLSSVKNKTTVLRICTLLLWPINPSGSRWRVSPYQWDPSDIKGGGSLPSLNSALLHVENIKAMNSEHLEYSLKAFILQSENVTHGHRRCLSNILPNTPLGLASCLPRLKPLINSLWSLHLLICSAAWLPCAGESQTTAYSPVRHTNTGGRFCPHASCLNSGAYKSATV